MNTTPKGISILSSALGLLKSKPQKVKTHQARMATAKILGKTQTSTAKTRTYPHSAASIESEDCACEAARELKGQRFLVREVPKLPLQDCTSPNCQCSYTRYKDRRVFGAERRALYSLKSDLHILGGEKEQRMTEGRRSTDESTFSASDADYTVGGWIKT
ncbi:MAG: hypothetical protein V7746_22880 [Halioglobus sp.]